MLAHLLQAVVDPVYGVAILTDPGGPVLPAAAVFDGLAEVRLTGP